MEAAGVITAVGPGLTGRKVGDRVAYAGRPMGSYAEEQILPAHNVVPIPPSVDFVTASAVMLKGMTAQFLLRRCFQASFFLAFFWVNTVVANTLKVFLTSSHKTVAKSLTTFKNSYSARSAPDQSRAKCDKEIGL